VSRHLLIAFAILAFIVFVGAFAFHVIEGWSYFDSLYFTFVTLSTVGYGDMYPMTREGKIEVLMLIVFGVGTMFYAIVTLAETMVEKQVMFVLGRGRQRKMIEKLKGHFIICGCGRIGGLIARELAQERVPFVIIEKNGEVVRDLEQRGYLCHQGDAVDDRSLMAAGIDRARGVVCVLPTDAQNLYVILTAKELNPRIFVLSRSEEQASEHRLLRAGADRVISPYLLGGMRMAMAILRPAMLDFIEITTDRQSLDLRMEEISVGEGSPLAGLTLEKAEIRQRFGLIIVAVKKVTGQMVFNPQAGYVIDRGDKLIALGENDKMRGLARALGGE